MKKEENREDITIADKSGESFDDRFVIAWIKKPFDAFDETIKADAHQGHADNGKFEVKVISAFEQIVGEQRLCRVVEIHRDDEETEVET